MRISKRLPFYLQQIQYLEKKTPEAETAPIYEIACHKYSSTYLYVIAHPFMTFHYFATLLSNRSQYKNPILGV